jgi:signal recognition particle subunit SRP54
VFDTLTDRFAQAFKTLRGKGHLTPADIDAALREIRVALLEADVNVGVVTAFLSRVRERAAGVQLTGALNPTQQIVKIVNEELIATLGGQARLLRFAKNPPTVIMLAGLQGAGKTTLAGKLGLWLKKNGHMPLLVAADLQRPNAVTQLQIVGERAGVRVFAPQPGNGVGDPVQVARDSITYAREQLFDVVVVDTAGRLGVDAEMMAQAAAIKAATNPDETLFVVDAMIGQDAVTTASAFEQGVGIDGVVLTKLDGDARGGAALSVAQVLGHPVMFASNGEGLDDFDIFHPDRMASRILGMGDMLTLIEQAERTFDAEQSRKAAEKLMRGKNEFTLTDFLAQMQQVRQLGPLSKVFGMLPGVGQMKGAIDAIDEREIDHIEAIIHSMTPAERDDVSILNGSRRARIARGAGVSVKEVNDLVTRFTQARKMMQHASGMFAGLPGMPGARGKGKQAPKNTKKNRKLSGNPAKRAQQLAGKSASDEAPTPPAASPDASAFGFTPQAFGQPAGPATNFELPPQLAAMFDQTGKGPQR